jgi:hypothetical protein
MVSCAPVAAVDRVMVLSSIARCGARTARANDLVHPTPTFAPDTPPPRV